MPAGKLRSRLNPCRKSAILRDGPFLDTRSPRDPLKTGNPPGFPNSMPTFSKPCHACPCGYAMNRLIRVQCFVLPMKPNIKNSRLRCKTPAGIAWVVTILLMLPFTVTAGTGFQPPSPSPGFSSRAPERDPRANGDTPFRGRDSRMDCPEFSTLPLSPDRSAVF